MTSEAPPAWRARLRASRALQVVVLLALWGAGELLQRALHLPFPGSIAGFGLLLALLGLRVLEPADVEKGAAVFLAEMLLFFVPAVVAVVDHPEWLGNLGLRLLVAILAGTAIVMLVTGAVVEACCRLLPPERSSR